MPDYGADPLWDPRTEAMVSLDGLPVSVATRELVRAWAARWERLARQDLDAEDVESEQATGPAPAPSTAEWVSLEADARAVWTELQRDLGEDWNVGMVSFRGGLRHVQWDPTGPAQPCPRGPNSATA
jgi:hypothetical protein